MTWTGKFTSVQTGWLLLLGVHQFWKGQWLLLSYFNFTPEDPDLLMTWPQDPSGSRRTRLQLNYTTSKLHKKGVIGCSSKFAEPLSTFRRDTEKASNWNHPKVSKPFHFCFSYRTHITLTQLSQFCGRNDKENLHPLSLSDPSQVI